MAKRKITVKWNGKALGTRTTDRTYTHALVLADFDPAVLRTRADADWPRHGVADAKSSWLHAAEAQHTTYRYARVTSDEERARYAAVAALSFDAYCAERRAAYFQALEERISRQISVGTTVLSYHGSRDLAFKAQAAARNAHPEYLVLVEPVEAAT